MNTTPHLYCVTGKIIFTLTVDDCAIVVSDNFYGASAGAVGTIRVVGGGARLRAFEGRVRAFALVVVFA